MRILLTGASGFLGSHFVKSFRLKHDILAIVHKQSIFDNTVSSMVSCDIINSSTVLEIVKGYKPEVIIHLAALSFANYCEMHPSESYNINVIGSENIANAAVLSNCKLVFTSSDLVFDGEYAPYTEEDETNPVSVYGSHKKLAENRIRTIYPKATICRLPLMYGESFGANRSFLQDIISELKAGKTYNLFSDEFRTPAYAGDIAEAILKLADFPGGVFHLGGPESLSRVKMGELICKHYRFDKSLFKSVLREEVQLPAKRPRDVSLDSSRAARLINWLPKKMDDVLRNISLKAD